MRHPLTPLALLVALTACGLVPTGAEVTIHPAEPSTLDDLTVEITVPPGEGDSVSYTYSWLLDGEPVEGLSGDTIPADQTRKGEIWEARVRAQDGSTQGPATSAWVTIRDSLPVVEASLGPLAPVTIDPLVVEAEAWDQDGDAVELGYVWRVDGQVIDHSGAEVPAELTYRDEVWEVTVTPTQTEGFVSGEPVVDAVTIANSPPSVSSARLDPDELYETTEVACLGVGWSDLDDDPETYEVEWLVDGEGVSTEATLDGAGFDKGQTVQCALTPFDGERGATRLSPLRTVRNSPPVVPSVSLSPTEPVAGDTIEASAEGAYDPDGDDFTLSWRWYRDGRLLSGPSGSTLGSTYFAKGDELYVEVRGEDESHPGLPTTSEVLTIGNSAPEIDVLAYESSTVTSSESVVLLISSSDPDGDDVSHAIDWYVDGALVSASDTELTSAHFERDSVVYAVVTPTDGEEDGSSATSTSLTILNSPPTAPVLAMDPEEPTTDDDLLCTVDTDSTDQDGDGVSYSFAWEVDGVVYTDATDTWETGDTVPAYDTLPDEEWSCTVTPDDGTEAGAEASASVSVAPDEEVLYVSLADLVNQGSTCSSTSNQHMYSDCSSAWGVSWADPSRSTPTSVTVDFSMGIDCDSANTTRTTYLNGSTLGTTTLGTVFNCDCEASSGSGPHLQTYTFTDMKSYTAGGTNQLTFSSTDCEGLSTYSAWGGYYAVVTISY